MISNIVSGLIITAISGITFLAYKHPYVFRKLYLHTVIPILISIFFSTYILLLNASNKAFNAVEKFIDIKQYSEARYAISQAVEISWSDYKTTFIIALFIMIYFAFLDLVLVRLIEKEKEESNKQQKL